MTVKQWLRVPRLDESIVQRMSGTCPSLKCPYREGIFLPNQCMVTSIHASHSSKPAHDRFSRFCLVHRCVQLIYRPLHVAIARIYPVYGWLGSRVVSVLDSGAEGPGFKSQSRRCRVTVLGKLFTPIVPLFTKQQNW